MVVITSLLPPSPKNSWAMAQLPDLHLPSRCLLPDSNDLKAAKAIRILILEVKGLLGHMEACFEALYLQSRDSLRSRLHVFFIFFPP